MTLYTKGFDSVVSIFGHRYNPYRFAFNSQEKTDEIAGAGNHNTALFWEYDTRTGKRWNLDPKPIKGISEYACFADNPIRISDILGDSVNLGNLYEKNSKGILKHGLQVLAFELFASSKVGKQYLLDHAEKGFSMKGHYIKDLNITAIGSGKMNEKGVDINFGVSDFSIMDGDALSGQGNTDDKYGKDGRLKIFITIKEHSSSSNMPIRDYILNLVDTYSHETFLEGDLSERDLFARFGESNHNEKFLFRSKYGMNGDPAMSYGISVLQHVQSLPIKLNEGHVKYSNEYLWYNIMMPGLNYEKDSKITK